MVKRTTNPNLNLGNQKIEEQLDFGSSDADSLEEANIDPYLVDYFRNYKPDLFEQ